MTESKIKGIPASPDALSERFLLSLRVVNPRRACVARGLQVCLSVCVSVAQHLTSRMFFRLTNDTTYLTGNEGQNICGDFPETTAEVTTNGVYRLSHAIYYCS